MMGGMKTFSLRHHGRDHVLAVARDGKHDGYDRSGTNEEVGALKAIGFQRGTITALFLGEALTVACIGAAIGIGAAALIFRSVDLSLYIPISFRLFPPARRWRWHSAYRCWWDLSA